MPDKAFNICPNCGSHCRVRFPPGGGAAYNYCPACGMEYQPGPDRGDWNKAFGGHGPIVSGKREMEGV